MDPWGPDLWLNAAAQNPHIGGLQPLAKTGVRAGSGLDRGPPSLQKVDRKQLEQQASRHR